MIVLAWLIISRKRTSKQLVISTLEWILLITGSVIVIISYTIDYVIFITDKPTFSQLVDPSCSSLVINTACSYVPDAFPWLIFLTGVLLHLIAISSSGMRKITRE
jgi:hypothetical protein